MIKAVEVFTIDDEISSVTIFLCLLVFSVHCIIFHMVAGLHNQVFPYMTLSLKRNTSITLFNTFQSKQTVSCLSIIYILTVSGMTLPTNN